MTATATKLTTAKLVWDGGEVAIPEQMGTPRHDQMRGTPAEKLTELAGRVCYDSLGKGRPSFGDGVREGYHAHILASHHGSVLEHFNFTIEIPVGCSRTLSNGIPQADARQLLFATQCMNHPGVFVHFVREPKAIRVTLNLRSALEWLPWCKHLYGCITPLDVQFAAMFNDAARHFAPNIATGSAAIAFEPPRGDVDSAALLEYDELQAFLTADSTISDHERWVSLFMSGSRGFSHEQVRHGDYTAISQRSTRYVDESESPWVEHPLYEAYLAESDSIDFWRPESSSLVSIARFEYKSRVAVLEEWLTRKGVNAISARKQARGASRGQLGNALYTEMIFSASVSQWLWMLRQRCSDAADAEIRLVYNDVLSQLKSSRYGDRFEHLQLVPAKDGIGMVIDPRCWETAR